MCMNDKTTLYMLYRAIDESSVEKIASVKTLKEMWDILEKVYKGDDWVKEVQLQALKGKLKSMRIKETKGVFKYITLVETLVNQFSRNGIYGWVLEKILRSLSDYFENIVCAIEESNAFV